MRFSPKPLSSRKDAAARADGFGALFQELLGRTIAEWAHFVVRPVWREPWTDTKWTLSTADGKRDRLPVRLVDGSWLYAAQTLGIRESERDPGKKWLTTLRHWYRWQATEDDESWIIRWEYAREQRVSNRPRAHLHVNGDSPYFRANKRPLPGLHIPAGRVTIEDVVTFLIHDHGIPGRAHWDQVVAEARRIFAKIQGHDVVPSS